MKNAENPFSCGWSPGVAALSFVLFVFVFWDLFIYFRDRVMVVVGGASDCIQIGGGAEGENLKQTPCWAQSWSRAPFQDPWDHDLSPNQESVAQPAVPSRCPKVAALLNGSCTPQFATIPKIPSHHGSASINSEIHISNKFPAVADALMLLLKDHTLRTAA